MKLFVICSVDWSKGADKIDYTTAKGKVSDVANVVVEFINFLTLEKRYSEPSKIQLVGHSLGAHIAGLTGRRINPKYGKINAIFALDPAGPDFYGEKQADNRLHKDDAAYTQAVHTNSKCYGYELTLAHADFYVNCGARQPGCSFVIGNLCSHRRAYELFAESISSPNFISTGCSSCSANISVETCMKEDHMIAMGGLPWNYGAKGIFYVETNDKSPFARE